MSHMLRSFLRQTPRCGGRDTANVTDKQHRERTHQDGCLGSTPACLRAQKHRIDGARPGSCEVCKWLRSGPLRTHPRWINSTRRKFLFPFHTLEGCCRELLQLCHSCYFPEIQSYMHPRRYLHKYINICLRTPRCTCTPRIYLFLFILPFRNYCQPLHNTLLFH